MNRTFWVAAAVTLLFVCASLCSPLAKGQKRDANSAINDSAAALFARAKSLADMTAPGTPPYALRIRVTGAGQLGGYPEGIYSMQFASPTEFRQDAAFGASHLSAGEHGDSQHQWRVEDDAPRGLLEEVFFRSLAYAYAPTALEFSGAKVSPKHREEDGASLECVAQNDSLDEQACFDSSSGALRAVLDDPGFVYQFDDFRRWGRHLAPTTILVFADNVLILRANVEFLTALTNEQAQASNFVPPTGAMTTPSHKSCAVEQARLISSAIPSLPHGAASPGGNGSVLFWGEIDKMGQIDDAIVMQSAGAAYDEAALRAMRQWRYAPARVCGEPVAMSGAFRIAFR